MSPTKYYMNRSEGPYDILWVTDRFINCHMSRSAMNYFLYYFISVLNSTFSLVYTWLCEENNCHQNSIVETTAQRSEAENQRIVQLSQEKGQAKVYNY
jgi:hypothetical protein